MLHLVLGRSGYGKTTFIRQKIKEKTLLGERAILIVPEQFSFESERALYFELGAKSSLQVEVLSFSRLSHNIFREYGGIAKQYVSEGGKNILMHMALDQLAGELSLYNKETSGSGFIKSMTSAVSELKQYGISPEDLGNFSKDLHNSVLKNKTLELSKILSAYNAMLSTGYADSDDDLKQSLEILREHNFFDGTCVFIDEFKGFTSVEIDILERCICGAKEVWAAFCTSPNSLETEHDKTSIFSGIDSMINTIKYKARENGITIASPIKLNEPYRYNNDSLIHIEKHLFSIENKEFNSHNPPIQIHNAKNYYSEIEYISSKIKSLVRDHNLFYRDIAIIGRNITDYQTPLKTVMKRYDIPFFYSLNEGIITKPLVSFILSILKATVKNYDNDSIFYALKTGLTSLTTEQISVTENYIFTWNIKGKQWEEPFVQNPRGFVGEFTDDDMDELESVNLVREYVYGAIKTLKNRIMKCNGEEFVKAVYQCLEDLNITQRYAEIVKQTLDPNISESYVRIWDLVCGALEEMGHILKHSNLTMIKFTELLELMFNTLDMGDIPQTLDQVLVGDASLVRPNSPKVVFVIGANEGIFPMIPEPTGIFSDNERKKLIELGLNIADSVDKKIIDEQFIAYKTLTSASDKLYLSYPSSTLKGTPMNESNIVDQIKTLIPNVKLISDDTVNTDFYAQNYTSSYHTLAKNFRKDIQTRSTLLNFFENFDEYKNGLMDLEKASETPIFKIENMDTSQKLFGKSMRLSPSKVEQYYKCRFAYFIENGLKLRKNVKAELNMLEIGSLIHHTLQHLLQKHGGKGILLLSELDIKQEVREILSEYIDVHMGGKKDKTKRFKYLYNRLSHTLIKLIKQLSAEFSQSQFEPVDFELKVGSEGEISPMYLMLPTGGNIRVEGIIDRVDIMTKAGQKYIRIVDYKTGSKEFRLSDVYYGINMQMLIYLFSAWQNGDKRYGDVKPAGILYMPAKTTPINSSRYTTEQELDQLSIKTFKMHGLVLDDPEIIKGMDSSAKGLFINVSLDKNGKPKTKDSIASLAELGKLKEYIQKLLVQMASELRTGNIDANPNIQGTFRSCDYCNYKNICGHEPTDNFFEMVNMDKKTFFENIGGDENEN